MPELLPTDLESADTKLLPCDICGRAIRTKSTNEWAAHWLCVVHGKKAVNEALAALQERTK